MLYKDNFFKNFSNKSKLFRYSLKKTKKAFKYFHDDLNNHRIPLLECYEKDYKFNFSSSIIKKFSKYQNIIVIGMGGSILGTKSIYSFFKKKVKKNLFFFDNLDENLHIQFRQIKNLKNSCFIIISKSGNTLETIANFSIIFSKSLIKNKLIFITESKDSVLTNLANKFNAEIIEHKDFIAGRYSVLSEVGMFPTALMGIDINKFKNLRKLIKNKNFVSSLIQNVASIYTLNIQGVKSSVIFNYDSSLNDLSFWYQQLVAESLGKKGKGITPILSFGPKDHHSVLQLYLDGPKDKFFTFMNLSKKKNKYKTSKNFFSSNIDFLNNKNLDLLIKAQFNAVKNIINVKKIPFRQIIISKRNEESLGMIFTFFVLETILLARLINVNPFDQPAIEEIKLETKKILLR